MPSLRTFAREYLMVVIGVLTALGLEQWVVHLNQHQEAATASARIEAEIHANIDGIRHARKVDVEHLKYLATIRNAVVRDFRAHVPDATIEQHILASAKDFSLDRRWPALHHEAWDMAIADQSLGWIDARRLQRYSAAYAVMLDTNIMQRQDVAMTLDGQRMIDIMTDLQVGEVQPRQFLHTIGSMTMTLQDTVSMLSSLEDNLENALAAGDGNASATTGS
jgi:hypothetical protein